MVLDREYFAVFTLLRPCPLSPIHDLFDKLNNENFIVIIFCSIRKGNEPKKKAKEKKNYEFRHDTHFSIL